jgi:transposase
MLRKDPKQYSFHSVLYDKIPENHTLKAISKAVDFSFINILLEDTYCKEFGRPAKEPELMCKLLFLQHLYNLSDEKIRMEASLNLAFMYFIGINPEDPLPDKSLLSKFRKHRLGEDTLDDILTEMVRQCVEKGLLKDNSVSLDATHIMANTIKKTPERLMKHLAKMIIHTYEKETGQQIEELPEVPNYEEISDHREAKAVMKAYLEEVIDLIKTKITVHDELTNQWVQKAEDILYDPKFISQKGVRSIVDEDARVGRKSKTQSFFGYKTELMMTTEERIITAVRTADGAYMDGSYTKEMLEQTRKSGMNIEEFYGDKAYFRKPILDQVTAIDAEPFIPVSSTVYRIDEEKFAYNKRL